MCCKTLKSRPGFMMWGFHMGRKKKKTMLEEILTEEQIEWVSKNREHPKVKLFFVAVTMANTDYGEVGAYGIRHTPSIDEVTGNIRALMVNFQKWVETEMAAPSPASSDSGDEASEG